MRFSIFFLLMGLTSASLAFNDWQITANRTSIKSLQTTETVSPFVGGSDPVPNEPNDEPEFGFGSELMGAIIQGLGYGLANAIFR